MMTVNVSRRTLLYKLRAASANFVAFLLFSVVLTAIAYHYWYPDFLFWNDGGIQGLRLVYAVDFVLGPLLALVFFHPDKSRGKLLFDIVFVALLQFSAMGWGTYQVYKERPIGVVYGDGRFISVATSIMSMQRTTPADLKKYSPDRPPFIYRRDPADLGEKQRQAVLMFRYGIHNEAQAWLFEPYAPNLAKIFAGSAGIAGFLEGDATLRQRWLEQQGASGQQDLRLAFYEGRFANAVLIFDPQGRYRDFIDLGQTVLPGAMETPAPEIPSIKTPSVNEAH